MVEAGNLGFRKILERFMLDPANPFMLDPWEEMKKPASYHCWHKFHSFYRRVEMSHTHRKRAQFALQWLRKHRAVNEYLG